MECFREFLRDRFTSAALLVLAALWFRYALGRSDETHLYSAVAPTFLLVAYLLTREGTRLMNALSLSAWPKPALCLFLAIQASLLSLATPQTPQHPSGRSRVQLQEWYGFAGEERDEELVPPNYAEAAAWLRTQLGADGQLFVMTSQAIWYYFLDKPSPTRFQVVWFAAPRFYQEEIVRDLQSARVEAVLYHNAESDMDGFSNADRLPVVVAYLREHYRFERRVGGHEIWLRK